MMMLDGERMDRQRLQFILSSSELLLKWFMALPASQTIFSSKCHANCTGVRNIAKNIKLFRSVSTLIGHK